MWLTKHVPTYSFNHAEKEDQLLEWGGCVCCGVVSGRSVPGNVLSLEQIHGKSMTHSSCESKKVVECLDHDLTTT